MAREQWINVQAEILRRMPPDLGVLLGNLRHLPRLMQWWFHPQGRRRTLELLGPLEGKFSGFRCVVIGNGPSLKSMTLAPLADEYTFGMNRIYLLREQLGFEPTYYAAINRYILSQFPDEIMHVNGLKFLNWSYRNERLTDQSTAYLETKPVMRPDGKLLSGYYAGGGTVTLFSLQLAYFMGFSQAILIGVDHNYLDSGTPNEVVRAKTDDRNHFSKDYFGKGVVWQLPDLAAMERGYVYVKRLFEKHGRQVVDATLDGKLHVFPKADLADLLADGGWQNRRDFEADSSAHRGS